MLDTLPRQTLFEEVSRHAYGIQERRGHLFSSKNALRLDERQGATARVARFRFPDIVVADVVSTGHQVDVTEVTHSTLLLPLHGLLTTETKVGRTRLPSGNIALFPPNQRITRVETHSAHSPYWSIVLLFAPSLLSQALQREGMKAGDAETLSRSEIRIDPKSKPQAVEFLHLIQSVHSEIARGAPSFKKQSHRLRWQDILFSKIADMLIASDDVRLGPAHGTGRSYLHVSRALEYIHENYATIVNVSEIAEATGVATRTLELAFKQVMGVGPSRALATVRLDAAHRHLTSGEYSSVTDIAFACGINHLSRFAQSYRSKYGDLPSKRLLG
ncbi:Helix-turn-helix domain-containing protein [Roseivivax lentus]|uniref:Helix-turn-helix domain-containing protein n=1 Tax=Roseivivax lentus TaxID=633194 RepID=A0A1N7MNE5_9RHOB|nr:helix-turn-helix transcriptional regulator [Roseivivax lentus]SIS87461.1 Helix-turn-helix domain-containing protein [Roseivivax lentus]